MGIYQEQSGNLGSVREFSAVGTNQDFTFGGIICKKINDSNAIRFDNGQLVTVNPSQIVTIALVTVRFDGFEYGDLGVGDGYESGGVRWIKCEGGAINVSAGQFTSNPPLTNIIRQKNQYGTYDV